MHLQNDNPDGDRHGETPSPKPRSAPDTSLELGKIALVIFALLIIADCTILICGIINEASGRLDAAWAVGSCSCLFMPVLNLLGIWVGQRGFWRGASRTAKWGAWLITLHFAAAVLLFVVVWMVHEMSYPK